MAQPLYFFALMKYAINLNSLLPIRETASEKAQLVTQLLFGECCEISGEENGFFSIKNHIDSYVGWADKKMLTEISFQEYESFTSCTDYKACMPLSDVFSLTEKSIYRLPAGSLLPNYNPDTSKFGFGDCIFQIHPSFVTFTPEENKEGIVPMAVHFLNSPYLWGGKSILGIDCSGFVQIVFSLNGISLPRDAKEQAKKGINISFEDIQPGDLVFFSKTDNRISHVGIYMGDEKIIHASGKVRISYLDEKGIYEKDKQYTHILSSITRI